MQRDLPSIAVWSYTLLQALILVPYLTVAVLIRKDKIHSFRSGGLRVRALLLNPLAGIIGYVTSPFSSILIAWKEPYITVATLICLVTPLVSIVALIPQGQTPQVDE